MGDDPLSSGEKFFFGVMMVVFLGLLVFVVGVVFGADCARQQAIDAGAAYWAVDEKTGVTEFKWRTCGGDATEQTRN